MRSLQWRPIPSFSPQVAPPAWLSLLLIDDDPQSPHPLPLSSTLSSPASLSSNATPLPLLVPVSGGPPPILLSPDQHRRGVGGSHPPSYAVFLVDSHLCCRQGNHRPRHAAAIPLVCVLSCYHHCRCCSHRCCSASASSPSRPSSWR